MRLHQLLGGVVAACGLAASAQAGERTLYLGAYGGSTEKLMMEVLLPAWEEANDAKVVYVPGNSTKTLAKLQAQKGNQELDVVFLDDGPMYQAVALGFCDTIKDAAIFEDVYDIAKMGTEKAIGIGFVATGLAYDKAAFEIVDRPGGREISGQGGGAASHQHLRPACAGHDGAASWRRGKQHRSRFRRVCERGRP
jgi:putative spermidine/putrescine transport system substrate-binding protein